MKFIERFSRKSVPQPHSVEPDAAPLLMALEPRIMFDASVAVVAQEATQATAEPARDSTSADNTSQAAASIDTRASTNDSAQRQEVVFVDSQVGNVAELLAGLSANAEVVVLDPSKDGLQQMADYLKGRENLDAVHLLSHGAQSTVQVGNVWLAESNLAEHRAALESIGAALKADGDLMLYGCRVGDGNQGQSFIDDLASITGADVAASSDDTGSAALGGNWTLERSSGQVETATLSGDGYESLLANAWSIGTAPLGTTIAAAGRTVVGDFDSDGDTDILYQTGGASSVWAYAQSDGDGTFTQLSIANSPFAGVPLGNHGGNFFVADFDGDGDVDVLIGAATTTGTFLRNDNGTFTSQSSAGFPSTTTGTRMVVGDFDNDGDADILYQAGANGSVWGYARSLGNGSFQLLTQANSPFAGVALPNHSGTNYFVADFDGDGDLDVMVTATGATTTYLSNSAGSFSSPATSGLPTPTAPGRMVVGDFDGDGDADILYQTGSDSSDFQYARSNGDGSFTIQTQAQSPFDGLNLVNNGGTNYRAGDFDGDGDVDLFAPTNGSQGTLYLQNGAPPGLLSSTPSDNATGVSPTANIVLTFDKSVSKGSTGNIYIVRTSDNVVVETIAVSSSQITGSGTTWTIDPSITLGSGTAYAIRADARTFVDANNIVFTGIQYNTTLNFVTSSNAAPVITGLTGDNVSYTEGSAGVLIDSGANATVTDADSANFSGGNVTVSISNNGVSSQDVLWISDQGAGATNITVSGNSVSYGSNVIGTFTGGTSGNPLVITLTNAATPAAVSALLQRLAYRNSNDADIATPTRTVQVTVSDGAGGTSTAALVNVVINAVNDAPTLTATGSNPTFTENGLPAVLFSGTAISTVEAGQSITGLIVQVTNLADASLEKLVIDGTSVSLTDLTSVITGTNGLNVSVAFSGTTATVTITHAGISTALAQTIVNGLAYRNDSDTPTGGSRTATLTAVRDSGGTANGGIEITPLSIASVVTLVSVNDAPVLTGSGGSVTWTEGNNTPSTPVVIDSGLTISDPDGPGIASATVRVSGNYSNGQDSLALLSNPATMGNIIGSWDATTGTLTLSSAGNQASLAQFQSALRSVTYTNLSDAPSVLTRTVQFQANDGSLDSSAVSRTITLTAVDDSPLISAPASTLVVEDVASVINQISISDVDSTSGTVTLSVGSGTLSATSAAGVTVGGTSSALTLTGTITSINSFIANNRLTYTTAANATANETLTISVDTASASTASTTMTLSVNPVNDAPVVTVPGSLSVTEDVAGAITGVSFSDVDAGSGNVTATFSVASGTLTATAGNGVGVGGDGTGSLTLSGTLADINALIAGNNLAYKTAQNATASVILTVTINDNGNTGGSAQTDTKTVTINVTAVNDAPVNTVPAAQTTSQDFVLAFNDANGNAISVNDVDAGNNLMIVTLTAVNGTVSLSSASVTFMTGTGLDDSTLRIQGTQANLNAALQSLTFKPDSGFLGSASLVIESDDQGYTGSGGTKSDLDTITISVVPANPRVTGVAAQGLDRTVKIGDDVLVNVVFDQAVNVNLTGGIPSLLLETGLVDRSAVYQSGSGSNTLVFKYTVQAGDTSADLDFQSTTALQLNGAVLANASSDLAILTLPTVGGANSLGGRSNIVVDGVVPVVASVSVPSDGTYIAGQTLDFTVNFNENMVVDTSGGTPSLAVTLDTGGTVYANYVSGSGTNALVFRLTAASGQLDSNGVTVGSSIQLNGSSLRDTAGNDAVVTLNNVASTANVNVDAVVPTVLSVATPGDGTYKAGDTLSFTVNASEDLQTGALAPRLVLDVGGATRYATYVSGNGSSALVFEYVVQAGDNDSNGIAVSSLDLSGEQLTDLAGNDLNLTLNSVGSTAGVLVDTAAPSASGIVRVGSTPTSSSSVSFTVTFNEDVSGVDASDFGLSLVGTASGTITSATQVDGRTWTVVVDSLSGLGTLGLNLNSSGTNIVDAAGNAITGGLTGATYTIDRVAPSVTSVDVPANGTYVAGQNLDFTVNFNEAVQVDTTGGTARIGVTLDTGGTVYASYLSGAGTTALVFRLTVASGQLDTDGISLGNSIQLNGATLRDAVGNDINTTLNGRGTTTGVLVDAIVPVVDSVGLPADGSYKAGDVLSFTVNTSEGVVVDTSTGTPRLVLTVGGATRYASYVSGAANGALVFQYTVQAGDTAAGGLVVGNTLDLNGGSVRDPAGNSLTLNLNGLGSTAGVLIDTTAPTASGIVRVDSTPTNSGAVSFTVTFDEDVSGVDTSDLSLSFTGSASGTIASVTQVNGRTYTVLVNGIGGTGSLGLNLNASGTGIVDAAGNAITGGLTGATYTIDRVAPSVSSVDVPANGTYVAGQNLDFTVNFNETVQVNTTGGVPRLAVTLDTGGTVYANYVSGSGTNALVFRLTTASGQLDSNGIALGSSIQLNGGTLRDSVGNDTVVTLNNVASTANVNIDGIVPTVLSVVTPADGSYKAGDVLSFTVNASEALQTGALAPRLVLDVGGVTRYATYVSGNGSSALVFQYVVQAGDNDSNGIAVSSLDLSGEQLTDLAGNDLNLTLNSVGNTAGVLVDTGAPSASGIVRVDSTPTNSGAVSFTVTFDEDVSGVDTSDLSLSFTGSASGTIASVTQVNGRTYTVLVNGIGGTGSLGLDLNASGTGIVDAAGNAITGGLTGATYSIDRVAPSVSSVDVPANGTYVAGQNLDFTVNFSEAVQVNTTGGVPRLAVTLDTGGTVYADYVSGSGTNALVFRLTAANGQLDSNGIALGSSIQLNGGTLRDSVGNDTVITLNNVASTVNVNVDGIVPTVLSVVTPADGSYKAGDVLSFTVNASEALRTGALAPRLVLDVGGVTRYATYVSGSGSSALVFQYVVQAGDNDSNGIAVSSLDLSGEQLTDLAGNDLNLTLNSVGSTAGVLVDTGAPSASGIVRVDSTPTNSGAVSFTVTFDEDVSGVDTSDLSLSLTGTASGTIASVTQVNGRTYTVLVNAIAGTGSLGLNLNASGTGIVDAAGNAITGGLTGATYSIDRVAPNVTSVDVPANGTYVAGQNLDFTVNFNEAVQVNTTGGTPRLAVTLNTGGTVYADYVSGSGTNALVFRLTAASGQVDSDGISVATSIQLNGAIVQDAASNAANLTLNGLGDTSGVLIDAVVPVVDSVDLPADGSYKAGDVLGFTVNTSEGVVVDTSTGTPRLVLTVGGATRYASYVSGAASGALLFQYTVQAGDTAASGLLVGSTLDLNGGTVRESAGNNLELNLNGLGSAAGVLIDTTAPTASGIVRVDSTPTNSGAVSFTVTFSESVSGVDASDLSLSLTGTASGTIASVTQVNGRTYTVLVNGIGGTGSLGLNLNASGTGIVDAAGNAITGGLTGATYSIDRVAPSVTSVDVPANGTYIGGQNLDFTVNFSENVVVDTTAGIPRLAVTLDTGGTVFANYVSGSGGNALVFRLTAASGQLDSNGIVLGSSIQLNGGTLRDSVGNDTVVTLNNVASTANVNVDGVVPTVLSVATPVDGSYKAGDVLSFTVNASEALQTGALPPRLVLDVGGVTRYATYVSGNGSAALVFQYVVQAGDNDSNGIAVSSLDLRGEALTDLAGNNLNLTLNSVGNTAGVLVDTGAPSASGIVRIDTTPTNNGSVSFTVTFNEDVSGVDASDFSLALTGTAGGTISTVTQVNGSTWTVRVDNLSGAGSLGLNLNANGTGIVDAAGNALTGGLTGATYSIDRIVPSVVGVDVPANGSYVAGQSLDFTVNFSEAVQVDTTGGIPRIEVTLDTGGTAYATYLSGAGTNALVFRLTVASGQLDSNGISVGNSIQLNGATLRDAASNAANLTLNGLGDTSGVRVDAVVPVVDSVDLPADGSYKAGDVLSFTVNTSEGVVVDTATGTPRLVLTVGGVTRYASYVSGANSGALVFQYTVQAGDTAAGGLLVGSTLDLNGGSVRDPAGNNLELNLNGLGNAGNILIDTTVPTASALVVSPGSSGSVSYTLTFSENVSGVDISDFNLVFSGNAAGNIASVTQVDGRTYTVLVNGIGGTGSLRLDLNASGTGIADAAGNAISGGLTGESFVVDQLAPSVTTVDVPASGSYKAGDVLSFTVNTSEGVVVDTATGTPRLVLTVGGATRYASYVSGAASGALLFQYTVQAGDTAASGLVVGSTLDLNRGSVRDPAGNNLELNLNGLGNVGNVLIDTTAPTASNLLRVDASPNNGGSVSYTLTFSENVSGVDASDLNLFFTGTASGSIASITQVDGRTYTVLVNAIGGTGSLRLDLNASGTGIVDAAGNALVGGLTGASYSIDRVVPSVVDVDVPAGGSYKAGDVLSFTVNTSEGVVVDTATGTPRLVLTVGGVTRYASYVSGANSGALVFQYTVQAGDTAAGGLVVGSTLDLNGGSVRDAVGNNLELSLNGLGNVGNILIDTSVPTASNLVVSPNTDGSVSYTLTFTENVSGVDVSDFNLVFSGTASGSIAGITQVDGRTYTVLVNGIGGTGSLRLDLNTSGTGIVDAAGNALAGGLTGASYSIDRAAPSVVGVNVPANGTYVAGQNLDFTVNFSEAVQVNTTGGVPRIEVTLDTGGTAYATYVSGAGTNALVFRLTVASGQLDATGISVGNSIELNGGTVGDSNGNNVVTTLNGLPDTSLVRIDAVVPVVDSVVLPAGGSYKAGDVLSFTVNTSEGVTVDTSTGTPRLVLTVGGVTRYASYVSGAANGALLFQYVVQSGDTAAGGLVVGSTLDLNGGSVRDPAGNSLALNLNGLGNAGNIVIDSTAPTASSLVRIDASPNNGGSVSYTLTFSENVSGVDVSDFNLVFSGTASGSIAGITQVDGRTYTVLVNGIGGTGSLRLDLNASGTGIVDAAGNALAGGLTGASYSIDRVAPSVTGVNVPANGTYVAGQNLDFTVNFSEAVQVNTTGGVPRIEVTLDTGGTAYATYVSGAGTNALVFRLTVASGQLDATGISVGNSIQLNGGVVGDSIGNNVATALNGLPDTSLVRIDAIVPTVTTVGLPATGAYNAGDVLRFTVNVSEAVNVDTSTGTPRVALNIGGVTRYANYVSGSGSNALVFEYTVQAGNNAAGGIGLPGTLDLNGGTVRDSAGNALNLALNTPGVVGGVVIDTVAPQVSDIVRVDLSPTNSGSVRYTVTFDESVSGVDSADFALVFSGSANGRIASVEQVNGRTYIILVDNLSGAGNVRLDLNSSATGIVDAAGNAITGGLEGSSYSIDRVAPSVTRVDVPANGTYVAGQALDFTVRTNEAVLVDNGDGNPRLAISLDNGTVVYANYQSGSGGTALVFRLNVTSGMAGNSTFAVAPSIDLNGGSIRDARGNDANAGLNNIGDTGGILVDAKAPLPTSIVVDGPVSVGDRTLNFTLTFDEAVSGVDLSDFSVTGTGSASGTVQSVQQIDATTYRITVGNLSGAGALGLSLNALNSGIRDQAGNDLARSLNSALQTLQSQDIGDLNYRLNPPDTLSTPQSVVVQPQVPGFVPTEAVSPLFAAGLFEVRTVGGNVQPLGIIFLGNGSSAPSFIAQVFGSSGLSSLGGSQGGFGGGEGSVFGSSTFAGIFSRAIPGVSEMNVFNGAQWKQSDLNQGLRGMFGTPTFGQQLQQINEADQRHVRELAMALAQPAQIGKRA